MSGDWTTTVETLAAGSTLLAFALALFTKLSITLYRTMKRLNQFFGDFYGEPARPGVPIKPGVVERIGNLELMTVDNQKLIQQILKETKPNGGSSMRDEIKQVHKMVTKQGVDDVEFRKQ